jgi:hypothetical protein
MNPTVQGDISSSGRLLSRPVAMTLAAGAGLLAAVTAALWVHYGTAVFHEMIIAGFNACF